MNSSVFQLQEFVQLPDILIKLGWVFFSRNQLAEPFHLFAFFIGHRETSEGSDLAAQLRAGG